ncbi:MAG: DUF1294 domain-containing protein [Rhodobacteraceae bacterium]|nr:DUF1294 domain-containing protein [Paracoccaceae bacterium]
MTAPAFAAAWLLAINLLTYAAFALDKHRARNAGWRIRESALLWLSFLGGSAGALLARKHLRHKTVKEPFRTRLYLIVAVQGVAILLAMSSPLRRSLAGPAADLVEAAGTALLGPATPEAPALPRRFGPGS